MNSFATFGIEPTFALDLNALAVRYRDLQSAVHPDRFANATDAEQRAAWREPSELTMPTTLKDPVRRAPSAHLARHRCTGRQRHVDAR